MKILGGDLEPSGGQVMLEPNTRLGKLRQDQFAFEKYSVIDTVIMGHAELWAVKAERDRIYALPEMSEEDGMRVGDLESQYAEMDGYTAESRAGELLIGVGIPVEQHFGLMSAVAPGRKLRVLLAQALFADPDVLLLDEPFAAVDPHTVEELQSEVRTLANQGIAILVTDHNVQQTLRICDRAYILHQGRNLREGDPKQIINDPAVKDAYLASTFRGDEFD